MPKKNQKHENEHYQVVIDDCLRALQKSPMFEARYDYSHTRFKFKSNSFHTWFLIVEDFVQKNMLKDLINLIRQFLSPPTRYQMYTYIVDHNSSVKCLYDLRSIEAVKCEYYPLQYYTDGRCMMFIERVHNDT
jgi:hypothetical protein